MQFIFVFLFEAVFCSPPIDIDYAVRTGDEFAYASQVSYECLPDARSGAIRRHVDGHVNKTVTCQQDGNWSSQDLQCAGTSLES